MRTTATLLLLLMSLPTFAQHAVDLVWNASATSGIAGYNVYRRTPSGSFGRINASPVTSRLYTDSTVNASSTYLYYVTAFCPPTGCTVAVAGESLPSSQVTVTVPADSLPLTITSLTRKVNSWGTTVTAAWRGNPGTSTYTLRNSAGQLLTSGSRNSSSGQFSLNWSTFWRHNKPVTLRVCIAGTCVSRTA